MHLDRVYPRSLTFHSELLELPCVQVTNKARNLFTWLALTFLCCTRLHVNGLGALMGCCSTFHNLSTPANSKQL